MKLQYLAQVQKLLNDYDFQDKYKALLELEAQITAMEQDGQVSREQLLIELGSPAEYVSNLIGTYDLSRISDFDQSNKAAANTDDLLTATSTGLETINDYIKNAQIKFEPVEDNNLNKSAKNTTDFKSEPQVKSPAKNDSNNGKKSQKRNPFKFLYTIILTLFLVLAFFGLLIAAIIAIGVFIFIDVQTAVSLILGVLLLLITVGLFLKLLKQILEKITTKEMKTIQIIITLILMIVFASLSKIMISSTLETVNLYFTNNLYTIQNILARYQVDYSNIDWANLDLSEFFKLLKDIFRAVL